MMEPLIHNEEFSNQGVRYDVLNKNVKFFDELMEYRNVKLHQLPHVQKAGQTVANMKEDLFEQKNNIVLKKNYVAAASDIHGDSVTFLGVLDLTNSCKIDKTKVVLVDIDTGEIYDTEEKMTAAIQKLNNNELRHIADYDEEYDEDGNVTSRTPIYENNRLIYLPRIEKNPNFESEINILGDYFDRGNEGLQNLAIIYYAKKLGLNVNFIIGNHEVVGANDKRTCLENKHIIIDMLEKDILQPLYIKGNTVYEHTTLVQEDLSIMINSIIDLMNKNMEFEDENFNKDFKKAQSLFSDKLESEGNKDLGIKLGKLFKDFSNPTFILEKLYEKNYGKLIKLLANIYGDNDIINFFENKIESHHKKIPTNWNDEDILTVNKIFGKDERLRNEFLEILTKSDVWKNYLLANFDHKRLYPMLTDKSENGYGLSDIDFFRIKSILIFCMVVSELYSNFNRELLSSVIDVNQDYKLTKEKFITANMLADKSGGLGYLLGERLEGTPIGDIRQVFGHTFSAEHNVVIDDNKKFINLDINSNYSGNKINPDKNNDNAKYFSLIGVNLINEESGDVENLIYKVFRGNKNADDFFEITTDNKENGVEFKVQNPDKKDSRQDTFTILRNKKSIKSKEFNKKTFLNKFHANNSIENDINVPKNILNGKGVTIQELKNANLNFPIFEDPSAKKLCDSGISQIDHVVNILDVTEKLVNNFRQPILNKYPGIKPEQIALPEGYVSNGSDYHGDLPAFLSQALCAGAITIDRNRFVAVDLDTGKVYSTLDEITELHRQIEKGELTHYNEGPQDDINNRIVYLPYTEINPNFKGRINFLGDYLDRGAESQFILGYIEYLSQLNKQTENPINMKFFLGNHDVPGVCGGSDRHKIMPSNPYYENVIKRMLYEEDIFEVCDVVKDEKGNFNSYSHTLFTILNLPELFNLLKVFLNKDVNIEDYINGADELAVAGIKEEFTNARNYFFNKFMNADENLLSEDYVNLRNKIDKLTEQLKNLELVAYYGNTYGDDEFNQKCFELYDQLIEMGFSDEEFLYLKNILGKATFVLHIYYDHLLTLLGTDLGTFFGVRPLGSDKYAHIDGIEEVEVHGEKRSIMFTKIIQDGGHTPYSDNHLKLSPHFRNYDIFMSGGYNETKNKDDKYPEGTAKISKLKFTFVNQNDNNTVLLTPNYYIYRDENQSILPKENFTKVNINEDEEKQFVADSINLDCSTEKMIEMFALNFTNKDKNLDEDKNDKSKKDIPNDKNDNDDHDLGNDDGKPKPDAPKIPLKTKTSNDLNFNVGVSGQFFTNDLKNIIHDIEYLKKVNASAREIRKDFCQPIIILLLEIDPKINVDEVMSKIALQEGCYAPGSDYHGDLKPLINHLSVSGAIILDKEEEETYVVVDINTGEVYDTQEKILAAQQKKLTHEVEIWDNNKKSFIKQSQPNKLVAIPHFKLNPNCKGQINCQGDFVDRGKKSAENLALIHYVNYLNKNLQDQGQKPIDINFFVGNHEVPYINGKSGILVHQCFPDDYESIRKMVADGTLKTSIVKKTDDGKFLIFQHTNFSIMNLFSEFTLAKNLMEKELISRTDFVNKKWQESRNSFAEKINLPQYAELKKKLDTLMAANIDFNQYKAEFSAYSFDPDSIFEKCNNFKKLLMGEPYNFTIEDLVVLKNLLGQSTLDLHLCMQINNSIIKDMLGCECGKIDSWSNLGWIWGERTLARVFKETLMSLERMPGESEENFNKRKFILNQNIELAKKLEPKCRLEDTEQVIGHYPKGNFIYVNDGHIIVDACSSDGYHTNYSSFTQFFMDKDLNFFNTKKYNILSQTNEVKSEETNIKYDETEESKALRKNEINFQDGLVRMLVPDDIKKLMNETKIERKGKSDLKDEHGNDNDDHNSGSDDDNDGKPPKGGTKIKIQPQQPKAKDSSEIDAGTRKEISDEIENYKIKINTLKYLGKVKEDLINKVDQFSQSFNGSITKEEFFEQLAEDLGKELNFLYECCISLSQDKKFDTADKRNEEMKKFLSLSFDGKISKIRPFTIQQVKLEELYNGVYEQINKSYFTDGNKSKLITIMDNPAISLPIRLNNVFENVLDLYNIENKELYFNVFQESLFSGKITNLNKFIELVSLIQFFDKEISDDGLKKYFTNMIQIQLSDPITKNTFNRKLSETNEKIVSLHKDYLFVEEVANDERSQKINEFKSKDIKGKIETLNKMQDTTKKLQTYQQKLLELISKIPSNQKLMDIMNNQKMSFRKKPNAIYQKLLKLDQKGEITKHSNFSNEICSKQMEYLEEYFEIYLKQINTAESKDEVTKDDNPTDELAKSSQEIEVSVNIEDEKTKEISAKISEYRKAIEDCISIDNVKNNLFGILNVPITNEENFLPQIEENLAKELSSLHEDCLFIGKNKNKIESKRQEFEKLNLNGKIFKLGAINEIQNRLGGYYKDFDNQIRNSHFEQKDKNELFIIINNRGISFSDKLNFMYKYLLDSYKITIEGENLFEETPEVKIKTLKSCFDCVQYIPFFNEKISDERYRDHLINIIQKQSFAPRQTNIFEARHLEVKRILDLWNEDLMFILNVDEAKKTQYRTSFIKGDCAYKIVILFNDGEINQILRDYDQRLHTIISDDSIGEETKRDLLYTVDSLEILFEEKLNKVYLKLLELLGITGKEKERLIAEFKNANVSDKFKTLEECIEAIKSKNNIDKESNSEDVTKTPVMRQRPNQRGLIPGMPSQNNKNTDNKNKLKDNETPVPTIKVTVPGVRPKKQGTNNTQTSSTPKDSNNKDRKNNSVEPKPSASKIEPKNNPPKDESNLNDKNNFLDEIESILDEFIFVDQIKTDIKNIIKNDNLNLLKKTQGIHEILDTLGKDCFIIQNLTKEKIYICREEFESANVEEKLNILAFYDNEQIKLQSQYDKMRTLISNSFFDEQLKNYWLSFINRPTISFSTKLSQINVHLRIYYNNYLLNHGINSLEERTPYLDIFEKFPVEVKFSTLTRYIEIENENKEAEQKYVEDKFHKFISKSKMTEEEKTNAMEEFKNNSLEQKIRICNDIDEMEKQNKAMEKQNEENSKAKNFKTLPLHRIPLIDSKHKDEER